MKSFKSKSGVFSRINAVFRTLPNIYDGNFGNKRQKQPSRGVIRKKCSENMQQIYRRTPEICSIFLEHLFLRTPQQMLLKCERPEPLIMGV